ncbi:hypothetical protein C8R43DRAFT_963422 [Mycena crocata]|nr:hypothetical protein C8R43DRAFT_963422 [Mycena crocata]
MSGKTPKPAPIGTKKASSPPEVPKPPPDYFTFLRQLPSAPGVFSLAHQESLDEVSPALARTVFTPEVMKTLVENSKWLQEFAHLPDFPPQILYLHSSMRAVCLHIDPRNEHPEWRMACWDVEGERGQWPGAFELPPKPAPPPPPVSEKKKKRPLVAGSTTVGASGSGQAAQEKKRKRVPSTTAVSGPAKIESSSTKPALRRRIQPGQAEVIEVDDSPAPESPGGKRQKKSKKNKGGVKSDAQVRDDSEEPASPVASGPAAKPPKKPAKNNKGKGKAKAREPEVAPVFEAPEGTFEDTSFLFADIASGAGSSKKPKHITALQHPDPKAGQLSDLITSRQIYTHYNKHILSKDQRESLFKLLPATYHETAQPIQTPDGEGFKITFSDIRRGKGLKGTKESPRCIECISSGAPCATVASGMYKDKAAPEYLKWVQATPSGLEKRFESLCQAFDNVSQVEKLRLPLQAQFDLQMLLYLRDILRMRQTCQTFEEFVACFRSGKDCEAILRVAMVQMLDARSEPNLHWVWYFFQDEWLRDPIPNYKSAWDFYEELDREVGRQTEPRGFFFVPANNALMYNAHWVAIEFYSLFFWSQREDYAGDDMGPSAQPSGLNPTKRLIIALAAKHGKSDFDPMEAAHLAFFDPFVEPPRFKGFLRGDDSQEVLDLLDLEADEVSDDHESFINDEEEPEDGAAQHQGDEDNGEEDESEEEEEVQAGQQGRHSGDDSDGSESSESEEEQPPPTKRRRVIPYGTTGRLARLPSTEV